MRVWPSTVCYILQEGFCPTCYRTGGLKGKQFFEYLIRMFPTGSMQSERLHRSMFSSHVPWPLHGPNPLKLLEGQGVQSIP